MTKLAATICALVALGLFAAGCGGDDNGDSGNDSAKTTEQKQPASGGGAQSANVVMKDIQFNPKTITVKAGGTVKWTNDDSVGHDVTGSGFKSGSSGGISQGATYSHSFSKPGTFKYRCTVHPGMEGTVDVK